MFYFKFFYLSTWTFLWKNEICLPYFAEGFKLKFIEMMVNLLRLRIFLKTDTFKYLLSQHLVALSRIWLVLYVNIYLVLYNFFKNVDL